MNVPFNSKIILRTIFKDVRQQKFESSTDQLIPHTLLQLYLYYLIIRFLIHLRKLLSLKISCLICIFFVWHRKLFCDWFYITQFKTYLEALYIFIKSSVFLKNKYSVPVVFRLKAHVPCVSHSCFLYPYKIKCCVHTNVIFNGGFVLIINKILKIKEWHTWY